MPRSRLAWRLVVPAALVGLVGWLAALEYRWLNQVSQADREQRRASLQQHAEEFANDFDRELSRLFVLLEDGDGATPGRAGQTFPQRYDAWRATARDPEIVRAIYCVTPGPGGPTLAEYHPADRAFVRVAWPPALASLIPDFAQSGRPADAWFATAAAPLSPGSPVSLARDSVEPSIPAVIAFFPGLPQKLRPDLNALFATGTPSKAFIAYLDRTYLASTFLPALATQYFSPRGLDPYRVAVIDPRDPGRPIMTSNWPVGTPIDPAKADASEPLFALRADLTTQVFSRLVSTGVSRGARSGGSGRGPTAVAGSLSQGLHSTSAPEGRSSQATFQLVVQSQRPDDPASTVRYAARPVNSWQLVLQHSSGSLETAVNQARRRNLWLSFGLLAVLSAGVVLIVTNAQRSERLARQQMDFVATVSHELRTPLAVIRAAAQNLSAGVIGDPARARQYGELIETEGRRLTDMVEQVLDYAGIAGARATTTANRHVDLGALATDVIASCRPLAASAAVEVESAVSPGLPVVIGDEAALRSAIQNLVTNALKYGASGHWLRVAVESETTTGREVVRVRVSDRGLGIDDEDRRHLFEPFYRGRRAVEAQIRGNGLGLSLVKRIVEAHGGEVTVESKPGAGATFELLLPASATTPVAEHEISIGSHPRSLVE